MSYRYMLDTNVLSDLIKDPEGSVSRKIESVGESTVCCSVITAAELRYGAEKANSEGLAIRVDAALSAIDVLPVDAPVDRQYGEIRARLEKLGTTIGPNDLLIAAHARSENLTLVTNNRSEFQGVDGLSIVSWGVDSKQRGH